VDTARLLPRALNGAPRNRRRASFTAVSTREGPAHPVACTERCLALGGVDFHLDIVGEDTLTVKMQRLCADLHLEQRVTFMVSAAGLRALMARAYVHVSVVTARSRSPSPCWRRRRSVSRPWAHAWGTSPNGLDAALAVPVGEPESLAGALTALLGDEELRCALGRARWRAS
jgi:hypothetical protein